MDERQLLREALDELVELVDGLDVERLQAAALVPLARTAYQMCGAIIAAREFNDASNSGAAAE